MAEPYYQDDSVTLYLGDALDVATGMGDNSVDCIVTSPPYFGLRDYGSEGQYGLEDSPAEYVETMRTLFADLRRVLADDGTLWLNLGDSYAGSWGDQGHEPKHDDLHQKYRDGHALPKRTHTGSQKLGAPSQKNLYGIPWRVAFALQDVFLFSKSRRYWFDLDAIRETPTTVRAGALTWDRDTDAIPGQKPQHRRGRSWEERRSSGAPPRHGLAGAAANSDGGDYATHPRGRNPGDVWVVPTQPFPAAHFAVMPVILAQHCILAGCKPGGTVLDPFSGSGTTGLAAQRTGRRYVGIDLSQDYIELSLRTRLNQSALDFESETPA